MRLQFSEQDVIDACCVFTGQRYNGNPQEVDIDLQFNQMSGFAAEAKKGYQTIHLTEQDMIDGIAMYLAEYHNFIPERLRIDLVFNEGTGIEADIIVE